jgi:late competence protein required for DNA uptake (superfamily II DNA/RNA helicase)
MTKHKTPPSDSSAGGSEGKAQQGVSAFSSKNAKPLPQGQGEPVPAQPAEVGQPPQLTPIVVPDIRDSPTASVRPEPRRQGRPVPRKSSPVSDVCGSGGPIQVPSCSVTVLIAVDGVMCKSFALVDGELKSTPYDMATFFHFRNFVVGGIQALADLALQCSRNRSVVLIRGAPTEAAVHGQAIGGVRRNQLNFPEPESGLPWAMLDFDNIALPEGVSPTSIEAIEHLIRKLPSAFHDASYFYQFSSSAGILRPDGTPLKSGINVHLFFYFSRPVPGPMLAAFLRLHCIETQFYKKVFDSTGAPRISYGVDESVLVSAIQPLYVAAPVIGPGVESVLKEVERQDMVRKGTDSVELPALEVGLIARANEQRRILDQAWKRENGYRQATSVTRKPGGGSAVTTYFEAPAGRQLKLGRVFLHGKSQERTVRGQTVEFFTLFFEGESSPGSWYVSSQRPTIARRHGDGEERPLKELSEEAYKHVRDTLRWFHDVGHEDLSLQADGYLQPLPTFVEAQVTLLVAPTGSGKTKAFIDYADSLVSRQGVVVYAAQTIALTNQMREDLRAAEVPYVHYSEFGPSDQVRRGVYITTNESLRKIIEALCRCELKFTLVIDEVHVALDDFMHSNAKNRLFERALHLAERTIMMTGTITDLQVKKIIDTVASVKGRLGADIFRLCRFAPVRQYPLRLRPEVFFKADFVALLRSHQDMKASGEELPRVVIIVPTSNMAVYVELLERHGLLEDAMVVSRTDVRQEDIEAARVSDKPWLISSPLFAIGLTFVHAPTRFWTLFGSLQVDASQIVQTVNRANRTGVPCEVRLYVKQLDDRPMPEYSDYLHAHVRQNVEGYFLDESGVPGVIDPHFHVDRAAYLQMRKDLDKHTGRAMSMLIQDDAFQNYRIDHDWVIDLDATEADKDVFLAALAQTKSDESEVIAEKSAGYLLDTIPLRLHMLDKQGKRRREFGSKKVLPKVLEMEESAIKHSLTGNPAHEKRKGGPHPQTMLRLFGDRPPWMSDQYAPDITQIQGKAAADKVRSMLPVVALLEKLQSGKVDGIEFGKKMRLKGMRGGVLALSKSEADFLSKSNILKGLDKIHKEAENSSAAKRLKSDNAFFSEARGFLKTLGVEFGTTRGNDGRNRLDPKKSEVPPDWDFSYIQLRLELLAASLEVRGVTVVDESDARVWGSGSVSWDLCRSCVHSTPEDICMLGGSVQLHEDEPGDSECKKYSKLPARLIRLKAGEADS